ncbi:MAG: tetratricopeptide repeat protein [Chloroflexota bacterium]|nr:MAG: tetratricopeptide repeat protein [Chloroflexota bacterium]
MTQYQPEEKARLKRQLTEQAISLAMQSRWEEAVSANQTIIDVHPSDVDAYNRLGKAYTELGRYPDASAAYGRALEVDPNNSIAKKNLTRLSHLSQTRAEAPLAEKVDPRLFIEEMGKTGFTELQHPAPRNVIAKMSAGDPVYLKPVGPQLEVANARGEYLGRIEPRLSLRLLNFMNHGNQYAAGITSLDDSNIRIIIKEVHQDPSMAGRVSFPPRGPEGIRPYIKDSLLRYELEDEELLDEGEYPEGHWEAEPEQLGEETELYEEEGHPPEKPEEFEL